MRASAQVWLGMGLGFILAGILVLVFPPPAPTKQEIEQRARALGMVYRDEVLVLAGESEKSGETPPAQAAGPERPREVEVYIPPGFTSFEVAELLARQGIVADARSFEQLIHQMGASRKLVAGYHRITVPIEPRLLVEKLTQQ